LHGLETGLFFRRRQDLEMLKELPKEMEEDKDMVDLVDYFIGGD